MARPSSPARPLSVTFVTPPGQRVGDTVLTFLLAAVLLTPLLAGGRWLYLGVVAAALGAMVLAAVKAVGWSVPWTLRVDDAEVRVGRRRIPLDEVTLVEVGGLGPRRADAAPIPPGEAVPLTVAGRRGRHRTIQLRRADADRALALIHSRAGGAAGVDSAGRDVLPWRPGAQAEGAARLARLWFRRAAFSLVLAAVTLAALVAGAAAGHAGGEAGGPGYASLGWILAGLVALAGYGVRALGHGRALRRLARGASPGGSPPAAG